MADGHIKVTRDDWLEAARQALIRDGVDTVKVMALASELNVSRSSFYWYFKNRDDLLGALLDQWEERNTHSILRQCARPAACINEAACNFFRCFIDPALFDRGLDFSVRAWARQDDQVRRRIDAADATRLDALEQMFMDHGSDATEADWRARMIYFMQLGYHALEVQETMEVRMARLPGYLEGFTGRAPTEAVMKDFLTFARHHAGQEA
ncbi:Transcriptional regulator, TetR family [Sulfitobacter noctilucicola]|uniref:AcrR family transcriptional regulator n=1 Tax=Sulfitobacter noctilucicola TaxID=1342301 RepID=A0A7W6M7U6_9RHOB|nr:TetR/AcrR family transcriptional regulator [Sulfitobacter noctilucicola]KIN64822.1 Transcriptional regulator, TetR family [Sulfitobacter noctilucicola]MBB4174034.1 AcrR family transcriptional regulator [Sulfitobacter noctilucicola]